MPESSPYSTLNYPDPVLGRPPPIEVEFPDETPQPQRNGNAVTIEVGDGGVIVDFGPQEAPSNQKFDANLALSMDTTELSGLCSDLLRGIAADDDSRRDWLLQHSEGIKYIGLKVEKTATSAGTENAPLEGMSRVQHPLLAEAILFFAATARGELLPASGPVKVRDDRPPQPPLPVGLPPFAGVGLPGPMPPPALPAPPPGPPPGSPMASAPGLPSPMPPLAPPGGPAPGLPAAPGGPAPGLPLVPPPSTMPSPAALAGGGDQRDVYAQAMEMDWNHYLTVTAKEYYPDTDRMLFLVGYGGQGVKKVYHCPIRRRPVSESIPIEDFIVDNAMTDLSNCGRKTHRLKMRPSILRRMQLLGVYRDVPLQKPQDSSSPNQVEQAKALASGVTTQSRDQDNRDHELYECYCELDLNRYAPRHLRGKNLPLPYRVTIEVESKEIMEVRRNWRPEDKQALAKEYFVEFPYVKGFGFYGIGLLNLLGNTQVALTASWRENLDSGMFSNFPGFIFAKGAGRQMTNTFRVAPGSGVGLDVGLQRIQDAIMPLPYKDLGPAFTAFIQHVEELGQRLGGTANIQVAEGKQEAPVGTTLALIEQTTKPIGAVLKRLHAAQQQEFLLLKERFQEDPEAFWRFGCKSQMPWEKEMFLKTLNDCQLVPVSDPNNPTSLHRTAKAMFIQQIAQTAPGLFNLPKVWQRIAKKMDIENPDELLSSQAGGAPPDPRLQGQLAQLDFKKMQHMGDMEQQIGDRRLAAMREMAQIEDRKAERESRERVAQINQETERLRLASTLAIHADDQASAQNVQRMKSAAEMHRTAAEAREKAMSRAHEFEQGMQDRAVQQQQEVITRVHEHTQNEIDREHDREQQERDRQHQLELERVKASGRAKKPRAGNG